MILKTLWLKIFNKKKYFDYKNNLIRESKKNLYNTKIKKFLEQSDDILQNKNEISFLHSGHLGDLTNSLPLIKEISKTKTCNLFVESEKKIPPNIHTINHPFGNSYLSKKSVEMILPLLRNQKYLNSVNIYNDQKIDINLNFFRSLPLNFNLDSVRWYSHLVGVHPNLYDPYIEVEKKTKIKNKIVIIRSSRRKNYLINYKFLNNYKNLIFLGLKNEYEDLKSEIPNLNFHDCKDFLEMADIIAESKVFIGNLSFGYTLAEGLKVPRLLESNPEFPLVYPNGNNAYDFYFQNHFESLFNKIYNRS